MSTKVGIQDIIDQFIVKSELDKDKAEAFAKAFFAVVEEGLEKDRYVKIKGFGTFKLVDVENRESINVNTGERFEIQGHTKITFTPENSLRELVNKPFAHFETVILNDNVSFEGASRKEESTVPEVQDTQKTEAEELPKEPEILESEPQSQLQEETLIEPSDTNIIPESVPVEKETEVVQTETDTKTGLVEESPQIEPFMGKKEPLQTAQPVVEPAVVNNLPEKREKSNAYIYIIIIAAAVVLALVAFINMVL